LSFSFQKILSQYHSSFEKEDKRILFGPFRVSCV